MGVSSVFQRLFKLFKSKKFLGGFVLVLFLLYFGSFFLNSQMENVYNSQFSVEIQDRNGKTIVQYSNQKGHYLKQQQKAPKRLKDLLVQKEDRFFYYHPGVNLGSMARAMFHSVLRGNAGGSSTITQQLVKILLGHEKERTLKNKTIELFYTFAMELHLSKNEILDRYMTSVFLGNQVQGFSSASELYFQKPLETLNDGEMLSLIATLSNPSYQNPWQTKNKTVTTALEKRLEVKNEISNVTPTKIAYSFQSPFFFEMQTMGFSCMKTCQTTLDLELSEKLRAILKRNVDASRDRGVRNGAIVVIKVPENELLAVIGSPNPGALSDGSEINMALEPRPIGSTVKPFIYLSGFENGLRPYTLVEDREYKYPTASGFPIYPKNYDGKYHGTITLHEALSNSLNVPSVKVLEYIGLNNFYQFLDQKLSFIPIQNLDSYQYGIALGGLEMDLLTLSQYFTLFPKEGILSPLIILKNEGKITKQMPPQTRIFETKIIAEPKYAELVNKILSDRKTGVEQFGIKSNLNLTQNNYALKTGTSRDFHDSWVVGYTPDFVVGVWIGNSENTALNQVSGQIGAGEIWREAMELLFSTEYNKKTEFDFKKIADFPTKNSLEFGLPGDIFADHVNLLEGKTLILAPHDGDVYDFNTNNTIPLTSRKPAEWRVDGVVRGTGTDAKFSPTRPGNYTIEATANDGTKEKITITVTSE